MADAIVVENLVKTYKKATTNAVNGISFSVKEGEFFAFLGPNGAGKTTTISILTTILAKTSGKIVIGGYDVDTDQTKVRESIGVIFQKPSLDQNLTAEENIRFHTILYNLYPYAPSYGMMPKDYKEKVHELTRLLGIEKEIFQPIKSYSGGMKRKLEIIRSLMHNPKVLFLDEPTSGLDPFARKNLWEYLQHVREKSKTTIFLTTHYLEEAEDADRVCIVNHGKIITIGTPAKIKSQLIAEFVTIDAKDRQALQKELAKSRFEVKETGPFVVYMKKQDIQPFLQSVKTTLTDIAIHTPSLEDAYLEIIEDETRN